MALNEVQKKERADYLENNLNITECSQKKPYVFISYASDNWDTVFKKAVVPLQKQYGLRVYADKAFDKVNDKWIVPMLRNVRGADLMIAFVSQSYIESYSCFLELLTAVNNKKQIVFIELDQELNLGDTTDQPNVERGVKNEILNQGANIATNTNNRSNDTMRAMKSAFTSISTLLEQDALSKYDISDAFINFFRDASINKKTINDLGALNGTIKSVSNDVFDEAAEEQQTEVQEAEIVTQTVEEQHTEVQEAETVTQPAEEQQSEVQELENQPIVQPAEEQQTEVQETENQPVVQPMAEQQTKVQPAADFRFDKPNPKYRLLIGGVGVLAAIIVVVCIAAVMPKHVKAMSYEFNTLEGNTKKTYIGTYTGTWKSGKPYAQGTFVYEEDAENNQNGFVYEGAWKDGLANGHGTCTYANGDVYVGEWADGKMNGQGTMTYAEDDESLRRDYVGEWVDGKRSGYGIMTWNDGEVYEGEWTDGGKNGHGTYTFANGNVYVGEWADDQVNGQGTYTFANGNIYEGEWADGKINGQCTITFANGDVYVGEWADGKMNGQGTMTYADGDVYEGEWENGLRTGQGTYTFADGTKITGEWENDEYVIVYENGSRYVGSVNMSGNPQGQGTMTYNNTEYKDVYVGNWKDGVRSGEGTLTNNNGYSYVGEWADDKYNGHGVQTYSNGDAYDGVYDGSFVDGKRSGQGTYTWTNGDVYVGSWTDDKLNGQGTYTYADGTVKEGEWKDGEFVK